MSSTPVLFWLVSKDVPRIRQYIGSSAGDVVVVVATLSVCGKRADEG